MKRVTAVINLPGDPRKDEVAQVSKFSRVIYYKNICVNSGVFCFVGWPKILSLRENHIWQHRLKV